MGIRQYYQFQYWEKERRIQGSGGETWGEVATWETQA